MAHAGQEDPAASPRKKTTSSLAPLLSAASTSLALPSSTFIDSSSTSNSLNLPPVQPAAMRNVPQLSISVAAPLLTSPTSLLSTPSSSSALSSVSSSSSIPSLSPLALTSAGGTSDAVTPGQPLSYFPPSTVAAANSPPAAGLSYGRLRTRTGQKRYREIPEDEEEEEGDEDSHQTEFEKAGAALAEVTVKATPNSGSFVYKLYQLVLDPATNHLVAFSEAGDNFTVFDPTTFAEEVLARYYRHSNFASFTRQLNMYGFRKVARFSRGLSMSEKSWTFFNPKFIRGNLESIKSIKRNPVDSSSSGGGGTSSLKSTSQPPGKRRSSCPEPSSLRGEAGQDKPSTAPRAQPSSTASTPSSLDNVTLPPISPRAPAPFAFEHTLAPSLTASTPAVPPPVAVPPAPRLRQLSGPFTTAPLPSGLTMAAPSPYFDPVTQSQPETPVADDATDALRHERDDLHALTRQMHRDLHVFSRQLGEMTERCEMAVNVAANLKALTIRRGAGQELAEFPDFIFDPRFTNPAASLAEIRSAPRPRLPLALQAQPLLPSEAHHPHPSFPQPLPPHLVPLSFPPPQQLHPLAPAASSSFQPVDQSNIPLISEAHHPHYLHVDTQHLTPSSSSYSGSLPDSAEEPHPTSFFSTPSSGPDSGHGSGGGIGLGILLASHGAYSSAHELSQSPERMAVEAGHDSFPSYHPFEPHAPAVGPADASSTYASQDPSSSAHLPSHLSTSSLHSYAGGSASSTASASPERAWAAQAVADVAGGRVAGYGGVEDTAPMEERVESS